MCVPQCVRKQRTSWELVLKEPLGAQGSPNQVLSTKGYLFTPEGQRSGMRDRDRRRRGREKGQGCLSREWVVQGHKGRL